MRCEVQSPERLLGNSSVITPYVSLSHRSVSTDVRTLHGCGAGAAYQPFVSQPFVSDTDGYTLCVRHRWLDTDGELVGLESTRGHVAKMRSVLQVNEYFDGGVKSIGFQGPEMASSVGVMAPGEYEFGTSQNEVMTVISGELLVRLPEADHYQPFLAGDSFEVAANQSFELKVATDTAYLCTYA
jgi:uncharacterized protein YaiE (UPF0345 family)